VGITVEGETAKAEFLGNRGREFQNLGIQYLKQ